MKRIMFGRTDAARTLARRTLVLLLAAGLGGGLAGCDDDDPTDLEDLLDQELVVGTYDYQTLAFDVSGQTFGEYDLLDATQLDPSTHFLIIANDGTVDLAFQDPASGGLEIAGGDYEMLEDGLRITFDNAGLPGRLLIPQTLELTYDDESGELSFVGDVPAARTRLVELVPELEDEPLGDPVPGSLTVVFEPR